MFTFLNKYSNILFIAIAAIAILLWLDGCKKNRQDKNRINDLLGYEHIAKTYKAKDGSTVNYNTALDVDVDDFIATNDSILDYIANLELKIKNVYNSTIITERLRIDTLRIPVFLTDSKFDTTLQVIDSNYNMNIRLTNEGLTFNTIEFPNRLGVTLTDRREKWWKKKESIVAITNSNPHMITDGITSYTFKKDKKWFNTWWAHIAEGAIIGGAITYFTITK